MFGFGRKRGTLQQQPMQWQAPLRGGLSKREIEAAKTDRLNRAHWQFASDQPINSLLNDILTTLRARAAHEAVNNAIITGVIGTHVDDIVGPSGPTLQVQSDNKTFNTDLEAVWREWWAMPDVTGQQAGAEMLAMNVQMLWTAGEYLLQIVNDPGAPGPVAARLKAVHPRRLETPPTFMGTEGVVMGVARTRNGRPTGYHIESTPDGQMLMSARINYDLVRAENIIHGFIMREPEQARGMPWLTSCLSSLADLRDYDAEVLDAARAAADMSVLLHTDHPDAGFLNVNETADVERRTMSTLPPGWKPMMVEPRQPANTYVEFRAERLRELGRPVGMPLMMIQLDSRKHNYSSARFDSQVYNRAIRKLQSWMERHTLNRLVRLVAREAGLSGETAIMPLGTPLVWTWTVPPHVDPKKEAEASTERLINGTSTLADECAAHGKDWEQVIKQRELEKEKLEEAGLPTTINKAPVPVNGTVEDKEDKEDKEDENEDEDNA